MTHLIIQITYMLIQSLSEQLTLSVVSRKEVL